MNALLFASIVLVIAVAFASGSSKLAKRQEAETSKCGAKKWCTKRVKSKEACEGDSKLAVKAREKCSICGECTVSTGGNKCKDSGWCKKLTITAEKCESKPKIKKRCKLSCGVCTPSTETPGTEAPETEAPETEAPETEAPETEAPETEAPETEAPETEKRQEEEKSKCGAKRWCDKRVKTKAECEGDSKLAVKARVKCSICGECTVSTGGNKKGNKTGGKTCKDSKWCKKQDITAEACESNQKLKKRCKVSCGVCTPSTETPGTEAPKTEAPETEAPETETPETEAPETDAPETEKRQEKEKKKKKKCKDSKWCAGKDINPEACESNKKIQKKCKLSCMLCEPEGETGEETTDNDVEALF